MNPKLVVGYVPVIHRGYLEFFRRAAAGPNTVIAVLGDWIFKVGDLDYFRKDIRRVDARDIVVALTRMVPNARSVKVIPSKTVFTALHADHVVMPDDHVSRELEKRFSRWFKARSVHFESVFLMWDRRNVRQPQAVEPDRIITVARSNAKWMKRAFEISMKGSDWWRRVGAVVVRGNVELITAHNEHFPTEHEPYIVGDPRFAFHKGGDLDATSAGHAEALVIARAKETRLRGADLYVTTFPCPPCAISIANAGFRRLFYANGYSMVGAAPILRSRNVELIRVDALV